MRTARRVSLAMLATIGFAGLAIAESDLQRLYGEYERAIASCADAAAYEAVLGRYASAAVRTRLSAAPAPTLEMAFQMDKLVAQRFLEPANTVTFGTEEITGDVATLEVRIAVHNATEKSEMTSTQAFTREGGVWKVGRAK